MVASYELRVASPLRSHRSRFRSDLIFWVIFLVGFLLRLRRYLQDRGLMHDDAQLASNIFSRSFSQLVRPLNIGDQAAPVGFLILQKTSTMLFGHGELALRLVPFLASVVVLPIFFIAVRKLASPAIALMALGWMALAEPLVRYSSEAKQYSTDVLWATVMLALAANADAIGAMAILTAVGAVLLWFSHPLLFVLGGIGITLLVQSLRAGKYKRAGKVTIMGATWLASFAANYLLISRYYVSNNFLLAYWQDQKAFAPLPRSWDTLLWYPRTIIDLFHYPLGILPSGVSTGLVYVLAGRGIEFTAVVMLLAGCGLMARRSPRALGFVIFTLALTLAASGLQRYPFAERLTLFFAPLMILPLAFAAGPRPAKIAAIPCAILFIFPVYIEAKYLIHPEIRYDARPAINYVKANWEPGDTIYLHWGSDVLGNYYLSAAPQLNLPAGDLIDGAFDPNVKTRPQTLAGDLLKVQGRPRVWVVFSMGAAGDEQAIEQTLDQRGKRIDHEDFRGSSVDLYDLK